MPLEGTAVHETKIIQMMQSASAEDRVKTNNLDFNRTTWKKKGLLNLNRSEEIWSYNVKLNKTNLSPLDTGTERVYS